ncbi:hypothetical protein THASP1DRAFT_21539 [Thamnocephalis sphaerospora]|uniref:Cytochrome c oxidase assembly protein COX20, mitochondrial n=1 Tax=Thamnocephalis sphaerospora TaxID=78915 RepID=A0A4P9XX10_9FUNG|nr:hypothetical protein THASP1DRAFT_21539 [Thamnocephalis sphaerospora]|eukprot:RKP10827.1 hypothetical protein THASP1DRAFT_21539 [Thamnocephalis sphaerospora]
MTSTPQPSTPADAAAAPDAATPAQPQQSQPATLSEALRNVSLDRMRHVVRTPCGRDSLLYGIGGGTAVGIARFLITRKVLPSANWAVGAFALISIGSWEWCHYQRIQYAKKMDLVVEKLNQLEEKKRREGGASSAPTSEDA